MTTEIRDEWLESMQKNGRAERWEVKLMAQELIELRKLHNEGQPKEIPGDLKHPSTPEEMMDWAAMFRSHLWYHLKILTPTAPPPFSAMGYEFYVGKRKFRVFRST